MGMQEKYTRKLIRLGNYSYTLTLPREVIAEFGWQKGQNVSLRVDLKNKRISIEDWEEEEE